MNHDFPVALSDNGSILKSSTKSDTIECIENCFSEDVNRYSPPRVDAIAVDGPAYVHMNPPRRAKTYGGYCDEIVAAIKSVCAGAEVKRLNVVFDVYCPLSRKRETREARGSKSAIRVSVKENTPVVRDTNAFLASENNKTELFGMIANRIDRTVSETTLVATKLEGVVSNRDSLQAHYLLQPCNKEEADDRIFLHVRNASLRGYRKTTIITVDTDVVVIACYIFFDLDVDELWIEYGTGKNKKWIPIHVYASLLGEEKCRAMLFWYTYTGCDTVSKFLGRGKKTAWKTWLKYPEATKTFKRLVLYFAMLWSCNKN